MSMHPPPDPDELASDLVDGLLDDDVAARLRSDPAVAARVEAIEGARAALRVPPPSSPGAVDRALAATFAALDRGVAPDERPPPPVTHLRSVGAPGGGGPTAGGLRAPVPAHRARRGSSGMPWLAAAAAIVLLGLVTIGILSADSGSDDSQASDTAASAEIDDDASGGDSAVAGEGDSGSERAEQENAGGGGEPAADNPPATTLSDAPADRRDLGAVSSAAELADRIRSQDALLPTPAEDETASTDVGAATGEGSAGSSACPGRTTDGDPARGESRYVADAVLDGVWVRVHVYDSGDGTLRLVATDEACVDVVDAPFSD